MKGLNYAVAGLVMILLLAGLAGHLVFGIRSQDNAFLDPIPQETLQAFQYGTPIKSKLQAVIAARRGLETTRIVFKESPQVASVEYLRYAQALARVRDMGVHGNGDYPGDMKVWFVVFLGEYHVTSPASESTYTPIHGCAFAIIDANDGNAIKMGSNQDCITFFEQ